LPDSGEHQHNVVPNHPIRHNLCVGIGLQSLMRDIIAAILGRIVVWGLLIAFSAYIVKTWLRWFVRK